MANIYITDNQGTLISLDEAFIVEVPEDIDDDDIEEYVRDLDDEERTPVADLWDAN